MRKSAEPADVLEGKNAEPVDLLEGKNAEPADLHKRKTASRIWYSVKKQVFPCSWKAWPGLMK